MNPMTSCYQAMQQWTGGSDMPKPATQLPSVQHNRHFIATLARTTIDVITFKGIIPPNRSQWFQAGDKWGSRAQQTNRRTAQRAIMASTGSIQFLGIGAQKAGTTWLFEQLSQHPGIYLPVVKELHYFDRSPDYPSPNFCHSSRLEDRVADPTPTEWQRLVSRYLARSADPRQVNDRWMLKYLFGHYDDDWYLDLFSDFQDRVCGEITPAYAMLSEIDVESVRSLIGSAKILFLMRNPIEREWSQFRFTFQRGGPDQPEPTNEEILSFLAQPAVTERSDYLTTIERWTKSFSLDNVFIGFYDDILIAPQRLLDEVCEFLGVPPLTLEESTLKRIHHRSMKLPMPSEVREELQRRHRPMIEALATKFGEHPESWLRTTS